MSHASPVVYGTGHRHMRDDELLTDADVWARQALADAAAWLREMHGMAVAVSTLAAGSDRWWARAALSVGVPLHAYLPYPGQALDPPEGQSDWLALVHAACRLVPLSQADPVGSAQRNRLLADNRSAALAAADVVLAVWDRRQRQHGTADLLRRALLLDKPIVWLDPLTRSRSLPSASRWRELLPVGRGVA